MDEDHMLIKPARGDKILREVEPNVRAVSAKEFKDFSRVINKDMYDQYKAEELKKKDEENKKKNRSEDLRKGNYKREKEEDRKRSDHTKSEKGIKRSRDKPEFDNRQEEEHARNDYYSSKERKKRDKDHKKYSPEIDKINLNKNEPSYERKERTSIADKKEESSKSKYYERVPKIKNGHDPNEIEFNERSEVSSAPPIIWARENLRVRLIDTKYKGGKHHKEKVIVRSVDTMESCSCITDDEKMLWDVKLSNLETVIPKQSSSLVLILNGSFKGQKGKILELHKEKEKATVQLLTDSSVILKLLYDDICEYVNR